VGVWFNFGDVIDLVQPHSFSSSEWWNVPVSPTTAQQHCWH